jgi:uncharacterized protein (TIGR03067 family)
MSIKTSCLLIAATLCLGTVARAGDLEAIQGNWKVIAIERDGKATSGKQANDLQVSSAGSEVGVGSVKEKVGSPVDYLLGADSQRQGMFRLDPDKGPKTIDLMYRFFSQGEWTRATEKGIYLLEGDLLSILIAPVGKPRPKGFTLAVQGGTLMVLTRQSNSPRVEDATSRPAEPDPILGKWAWFTGGAVTIRKDGTMQHEFGNEGTWERMGASRNIYTLKWRYNEYIDTLTISEDRQGLAGANQTGFPVDARRVKD